MSFSYNYGKFWSCYYFLRTTKIFQFCTKFLKTGLLFTLKITPSLRRPRRTSIPLLRVLTTHNFVIYEKRNVIFAKRVLVFKYKTLIILMVYEITTQEENTASDGKNFPFAKMSVETHPFASFNLPEETSQFVWCYFIINFPIYSKRIAQNASKFFGKYSERGHELKYNGDNLARYCQQSRRNFTDVYHYISQKSMHRHILEEFDETYAKHFNEYFSEPGSKEHYSIQSLFEFFSSKPGRIRNRS
jgi:hypothetical protein